MTREEPKFRDIAERVRLEMVKAYKQGKRDAIKKQKMESCCIKSIRAFVYDVMEILDETVLEAINNYFDNADIARLTYENSRLKKILLDKLKEMGADI